MAESQIEWTDSTWNPVAGCSIITAGCTHCYAMEMAKRLEAMGIEKYSGLTRKTGKRTVWNGVVREDREALAIPYGWKKPRKIFVNSMATFSTRRQRQVHSPCLERHARNASPQLSNPDKAARTNGIARRLPNMRCPYSLPQN
jgi:protein gp37